MKITRTELEKEYLEHILRSIDKGTLSNNCVMLNNFCQSNETNQNKTYPSIKVNFINQARLEKWESGMSYKT